jgi:hypothetical protein
LAWFEGTSLLRNAAILISSRTSFPESKAFIEDGRSCPVSLQPQVPVTGSVCAVFVKTV